MEKITSNDQLIPGKSYWCLERKGSSDISIAKCTTNCTDDRKILGNIWALNDNNQALERWYVLGPIQVPSIDDFIG